MIKKTCSINHNHAGHQHNSRFWSLIEKRFPALAGRLFNCPVCRDELIGIGNAAGHFADHFR